MSIPAKFMEIARDKLERSVFDDIYARAVELEREALAKPIPERVHHPIIAERIAAHLNDENPPPPPPKRHAAAQIERRMDIEVGPLDLGDLLRVVRAGGPTISVIRQSMDLVQELEVSWRGKNFVVIYSKSRDKLITAYPKAKKRKFKKIKVGRPKDWRDDKSYEFG
jgi:hypothetical protein